jgi:salicylate hydroxylase
MLQRNVNLTRDVAVVGTGIGGLTTAIALSQPGCAVHIFEREAGLSEAGASIWTPANAMQIFSLLRLADAIRRSGVEILRIA